MMRVEPLQERIVDEETKKSRGPQIFPTYYSDID